MLRSPYPHQRDGLRWSMDHDQIALLWEMRLGKSLVAVRWADHKAPASPKLIVCPLDVMETWVEELKLENHPVRQLRGYAIEPEAHGEWYITSYESLRGNRHIQQFPWAVVILDESTFIRNPKAKITKICLAKFKNVPHKAILSGLPAPENVLEYFCQFVFLKGKFLGHNNYWSFRASLFEPGAGGWDWWPKKGVLPRILSALDECSHVLTRKQVGMGGVQIKESRRYSMPTLLEGVYKHAESQFILGDQSTMWKPVVQTWLARLAGGCHPICENDYKIQKLIEILKNDLRGQQVVVWCNYNSEISAIMKALKGFKRAAIHGGIKPGERAKINWEFQNNKLDVLVCQVKCAQYGRNFSAADTSIYYSLPWDLKSYLQSKDRIVHPGKQAPTLTLHLLGRDSIDEDVLFALLEKKNTSVSIKSLIGQHFRDRVLSQGAV